MTELLPFVLSILIGFLLVTVFDPLRAITPRWAALLFRVCLGSLLGIGFSAFVYFTLLAAGLARPWTILTIELASAAVLVWLWMGRRDARAERPGSSGSPAAPSRRSPPPDSPRKWLAGILTVIFTGEFLLVSVRLAQISFANPPGEWDAALTWNLRAKFLTDPQNWRMAFSALLDAQRAYPILTSAFIAHAWKLSGAIQAQSASRFAGAYPATVPIALGLTFWTVLLGLMVSVLAMIRGTIAAMLAGLVLLSTAPLLFWATGQYADIPLSCYFLATLALLFLDARTESSQPWTLVWAGVCAALAAGTKDEGQLFAILVSIAFLAGAIQAKFAGRPSWHRAKRFFAGMLPALLPTLGLKLFLSSHSHMAANQTVSGIIAKIEDPSRYQMIGKALLDLMMGLGSGAGHPWILLVFLALILRAPRDPRDRFAVGVSSVAVAGMFLSYLAAYVITPHELSWHLSTSLDRLMLQIWPCFVFLFCRVLPDDGGFAFTKRAGTV
jgi:hypothetical protein